MSPLAGLIAKYRTFAITKLLTPLSMKDLGRQVVCLCFDAFVLGRTNRA